MYRIGIDLGGTNIAAGIVDETGRLMAKRSEPTGLPKAAQALAQDIRELAGRLLEENGLDFKQVRSAGIGIPGTVNQENGSVEYANNFGFEQVPFVNMLRALFPCPLYAENDAKAAAWGEYRYGAGRGVSSLLAVTLGTGVGGGLILDGKIWEGFNGAAGEIGHMVIRRGGRPCTCGRRGCLEAYASASALCALAKERAGQTPDSMLNLSCGGDLEKLNGRAVFDCADQGDPAAAAVLDEFLDSLAEGVANLVNILQPEAVLIGGGLSGAGDQLLLPLKEKAYPLFYSRLSEKNPEILLAELGNDAGIIGAAVLEEAKADSGAR